MTEILLPIMLVVLAFILYKQVKDIERIVGGNTQFHTSYVEYVKAISEHNKIVHECLGKLDEKAVTGYYATTKLAAHVEYLEERLNTLERKQYAQ